MNECEWTVSLYLLKGTGYFKRILSRHLTWLDPNYLQILKCQSLNVLWISWRPTLSLERSEGKDGSHHVCGLWLSRWRKGQSRESVTHEEMMERFAALSKQLLSFGHIWTGRFCCFATRNFQQPELSRQTLSAWSMAANKPVSRVLPIILIFSLFLTKIFIYFKFKSCMKSFIP